MTHEQKAKLLAERQVACMDTLSLIMMCEQNFTEEFKKMTPEQLDKCLEQSKKTEDLHEKVQQRMV
jgi:hypothetical protein